MLDHSELYQNVIFFIISLNFSFFPFWNDEKEKFAKKLEHYASLVWFKFEVKILSVQNYEPLLEAAY